MLDDPKTGVLISNGRSGVRLVRASSRREYGYPTVIDVKGGPFTGTVDIGAVDTYPTFRAQLVSLYETLSGVSHLGTMDGFSLDLTGDGKGGISVSVEVVAEYVPLARLKFQFAIDQTYLPEIIRRVDLEFPS